MKISLLPSLIAVLMLFFLFPGCAPVGKALSGTHLLDGIPAFTTDSLVHAVIEIPAGSRAKWEVDKNTGQLAWEKLSDGSFRNIDYLAYPANYGFVPQTLLSEETGGDGDPVDLFILGSALERGSTVKVKIIGIIHMTDQGESDSKLIAVNTSEDVFAVNSLSELQKRYPGVTEILSLWLQNYKGKGIIKVLEVQDEKEALEYLKTAHSTYLKQFNP